jgi:V-type H+-transporting ATPase subunit C
MRDLIMDSLDSLLKTNDDLVRLDLEMESFLKALEKKCLELDPQFKFYVNIKEEMVNIDDAIARFSWEEQKYPKNHKTIDEVVDRINFKFTISKNNFKAKSDDYSSECEKLKQKIKSDNEAASLMKVDYREIIKRTTNHMITTDYLRTMLCFVPTSNVESFLKGYTEIAEEMVLPYSAHQLDSGEDEKMSLWRVLVMDHKKEEFIQQARLKFKALVKQYDEDEIKRLPKEIDDRQKQTHLVQTKKNELISILKTLYSDMYNVLLHLKVNLKVYNLVFETSY